MYGEEKYFIYTKSKCTEPATTSLVLTYIEESWLNLINIVLSIYKFVWHCQVHLFYDIHNSRHRIDQNQIRDFDLVVLPHFLQVEMTRIPQLFLMYIKAFGNTNNKIVKISMRVTIGLFTMGRQNCSTFVYKQFRDSYRSCTSNSSLVSKQCSLTYRNEEKNTTTQRLQNINYYL